jgi:hypothetical protein
MADVTTITSDDVTASLKTFLSVAHPSIEIDENGYVLRAMGPPEKSSDGVAYYKYGKLNLASGGDMLPVILYKSKITDHKALIINPYAEGQIQSAANQYFYRAVRQGTRGYLGKLMAQVLRLALEEQKKSKADVTKKAKTTKSEESHLSMQIVKLVSLCVGLVDDKTLVELAKLAGDDGFLDISYRSKTACTVFRIPFLESPEDKDDNQAEDVDGVESSGWKSKFSIRKRTWTVFENLLRAIFDIKSSQGLEKFDSRPDPEVGCVRLHTFLMTIFKIWNCINSPLIDLDPNDGIEMDAFSTHLDNIKYYFDIAKNMIQVTRPGVQTQVAPPIHGSPPGVVQPQSAFPILDKLAAPQPSQQPLSAPAYGYQTPVQQNPFAQAQAPAYQVPAYQAPVYGAPQAPMYGVPSPQMGSVQSVFQTSPFQQQPQFGQGHLQSNPGGYGFNQAHGYPISQTRLTDNTPTQTFGAVSFGANTSFMGGNSGIFGSPNF